MILVTGATGNVGREVVNLLLDDGQEVVAVTRNPADAALPGGARVVGGDPSHPQTLTSALHSVEAVLISPRALGDTTAGAATAELLALAAEQGVERAVALSAVTVQYPAGYRRFADSFKAVEDAVKTSGLQWTFLRSADYAANTLAWAPQIRSASVVRGAYGDAATSTIHERDVAAVAARALVDPPDNTEEGAPHPRSRRPRALLRLCERGKARGVVDRVVPDRAPPGRDPRAQVGRRQTAEG